VKRAPAPGGPYVTVACPTSTSYTDSGLTNGATYYYVVSAAFTAGTNAGGESPDSLEASATPQLLLPPAPTGLTATPGNTQVALSWNAAAGAGSYRVKRATTSGGPYTTIARPFTTSYTDSGLTNGTTYYYVVSGVNSAGEGPNSSQVSATPQLLPPAPPTNLSATMDNRNQGVINLHWTQSSSPGVTQNRIYSRSSGGTYPSTPTATIAATTSYSDRNLMRHATYCYVVTAVSSAGESSRSNESCARTK
jgi:cellulose 1,4-beta-cellobiosidase